MDCLGATVRRARGGVLDEDWPASLEEGPQDEPDKGLLARLLASGLPDSSELMALNSSAVMITRFAKIGLLSHLS